MKSKLKSLLILPLLLISSITQANTLKECKSRVERVVLNTHDKLNRPKYVQVVKNILDKSKDIPVTVGTISLYNDGKLEAFNSIVSPLVWGSLFKGNTVMENKVFPNTKFIIYPLRSFDRSYLSGYLVLGYDEVSLDKKLELNLELAETYLSQILEYCKVE